MNKKFLSFALMGTLILPCISGLVGCGKDMSAKFELAQGASNHIETIISDLEVNIYNSSQLGSSTKYRVEEIKAIDNDFVYYVNIGTVKNIEDVETVAFGDESFSKDQIFDLSIGNSNFISDKCFFEEDNKLYIAAPIVAFETVNNAKIKINNNEFDFNFNKTANVLEFTNVEFSSGSTNTLAKNNDGSYNLQFKDANSYLNLYYDNASANDVVLTKKRVSNSGNENINEKVSYGLTKVESTTGNPLAFYPIGYSINALTDAHKTAYDGAVMTYEVYVKDKGISSATFNYDVILANE